MSLRPLRGSLGRCHRRPPVPGAETAGRPLRLRALSQALGLLAVPCRLPALLPIRREPCIDSLFQAGSIEQRALTGAVSLRKVGAAYREALPIVSRLSCTYPGPRRKRRRFQKSRRRLPDNTYRPAVMRFGAVPAVSSWQPCPLLLRSAADTSRFLYTHYVALAGRRCQRRGKPTIMAQPLRGRAVEAGAASQPRPA